ncbi:hypothetical protein SAMN05878482_10420 [Peribacillus simplex]|uniref:Uncharacterized protein n=2 Tax=Peribacillus simplex TaxID=1478 RepID=A0A9X8WKZ2_9BACI|nr:hypothetical protein SAMN05878482_10420 [Peribacillus simplex]
MKLKHLIGGAFFIGVRTMKLSERILKEQKKLLQKKSEKMSHRDWEEIMGMNRDTFSRKRGGAITKKNKGSV